MRRRAVALALAASLLPLRTLAEDISWPGRGTIRLAVPSGWVLTNSEPRGQGYFLRVQPGPGAALVAQITLVALPPGKAVHAEDVKPLLEETLRPYLAGSVEKALEPKPLPLGQGSGWFVQLTDASLVGKPPVPGNFKIMRSAFAALDDRLLVTATIQFDDAARPEVATSMTLLSTLRFERSTSPDPAPAAAPDGGFDFTVPQSGIVLRVPAIGLKLESGARSGATTSPGYFKASRREPMLILSGWLEPASAYKGLEAFWASERTSPAYAGAGAPRHVDFLRVGPWEVVAFDIPLPGGGTDAHVRAERVVANTWIDLHLSSASAKAGDVLRAELLAALRSIEVVEK